MDDEWRFAPDQPTVADIDGRINNFIDVSDFVAYSGDESYLSTQHSKNLRMEGQSLLASFHLFFRDSGASSIAEGNFSQIRPELDEYTKEPPPLPPHLRQIILNTVS